MNIRKLVVVFLVIVLMIGLAFGLGSVKAKEPAPDLVTNEIVYLNPVNIQKLQSGAFGIVTWAGSNYVGIAINTKDRVINTDIVVFSNNKDLSQIPITQGVFVKLVGKEVHLYFAHSDIIEVPWGELSTWYPAGKRLDQELIVGKIITVQKTGARKSETDYCSNPPIKKVWYFVKISVATENEKDITMKMEVKVPESELDDVLASQGSYLWMNYWNLHVYILGQQ